MEADHAHPVVMEEGSKAPEGDAMVVVEWSLGDLFFSVLIIVLS